MWIWFAIPLGVAVVAFVIAIAWHGGTESIYVGIVERGLAVGPVRNRLQVRAYIHEPLVHELPQPSPLIGHMFIRETNTSVPLTFVRVPPHGAPRMVRAVEWQERVEVPIVPVIFRFDDAPEIPVRAGQLVDVWIEKRPRVVNRHPWEKTASYVTTNH
jgi:HlyD family secretion protein